MCVTLWVVSAESDIRRVRSETVKYIWCVISGSQWPKKPAQFDPWTCTHRCAHTCTQSYKYKPAYRFISACVDIILDQTLSNKSVILRKQLSVYSPTVNILFITFIESLLCFHKHSVSHIFNNSDTQIFMCALITGQCVLFPSEALHRATWHSAGWGHVLYITQMELEHTASLHLL